MAHQYKIGDRVRRKWDAAKVKIGALGSVVTVGASEIAVQWDSLDQLDHYTASCFDSIEPAPAEAAPKQEQAGLGLASQEHAARCAAQQASQQQSGGSLALAERLVVSEAACELLKKQCEELHAQLVQYRGATGDWVSGVEHAAVKGKLATLENENRQLRMQLGDVNGCYDALARTDASLREENAWLERELASLKRRR